MKDGEDLVYPSRDLSPALPLTLGLIDCSRATSRPILTCSRVGENKNCGSIFVAVYFRPSEL